MDEVFSNETLLSQLNRLQIIIHETMVNIRKNSKDKDYNRKITKWFLNLEQVPKLESDLHR